LMERSWRDKHKDGDMFGYGSALCAAIIRKLIANHESPDIPRALQDGLAAMQTIYRNGFVTVGHHWEIDLKEAFRTADSRDDWPLIDNVALNNESNEALSILKSRELSEGEILKISKHTAVGGPEYLEGLPIARFGKLVTVNRHEIEGLRSVHNLIANYKASVKLASQPLAIAIFGAPGAGKSYAVKQLIKREDIKDGEGTEDHDSGIEYVEFNLSQFCEPSDLVSALHRVRDIALTGKIPLAFWDEFDTPLGGQRLGWLRYFLAPIQDGAFQQAELLHRVGPAIFVFGGSQFTRFRDFNRAAVEVDPALKVLDFLSRLRGYMDISGIDQQGSDPYFMLQRAPILYNHLAAKDLARARCGVCGGDHDAIDIQDGILTALLSIPKYKHGVRSMLAIVEMSRLIRPAQRFLMAALPSMPQLNMHVDGAAFLKIARTAQWHIETQPSDIADEPTAPGDHR